jgi:DNA-binding MarR family transcriptional regulator
MTQYSKNARDLNEQIQAIIRQQRIVDCTIASDPLLQLNRQELYVVEYIGSNGPCIMSDLARFLMVAVNTVTSIVDGLERKDVVRRERSEVNRRKVWLHLTKTGQECFAEHQKLHLQLAESLLAALNPDEQQIYLVLMRKIGRAAEQCDSQTIAAIRKSG